MIGGQIRRSTRLVGVLAAFGTVVAASATVAAAGDSTRVTASSDGVIEVPSEVATIQAAVDAAAPGDLILIEPGVYHEAVDVTTDELTIRGLDRDGVVLDGEFELDNGIRVLGASGVTLENLTVQNYSTNGIFWTGVDGFRGSYLTAIRNQLYGIYAFDSQHGVIEHSYAAGSGDGGFYVGQCYPCHTLVQDVVAEYNGIGFSDADAGGDLLVVDSTFRRNRVGVLIGSHTYELCYPQREATVVGNLVYENDVATTAAIDLARLAMGNGIVVAGGIGNRIERNRIWGHDRTAIAIIPNPENEPNDDMPTREQCDLTCAESRDLPLADPLPELNLWQPYDNRVIGNVMSESGHVDLAVASPAADLPTFGNCASANDYTATAPTALESLAPCDGDAGDGDWADGAYDIIGWLDAFDSSPEGVPYEDAELPPLPALEDMPDAATAPAAPAVDLPPAVDVDAIVVPPLPD